MGNGRITLVHLAGQEKRIRSTAEGHHQLLAWGRIVMVRECRIARLTGQSGQETPVGPAMAEAQGEPEQGVMLPPLWLAPTCFEGFECWFLTKSVEGQVG